MRSPHPRISARIKLPILKYGKELRRASIARPSKKLPTCRRYLAAHGVRTSEFGSHGPAPGTNRHCGSLRSVTTIPVGATRPVPSEITAATSKRSFQAWGDVRAPSPLLFASSWMAANRRCFQFFDRKVARAQGDQRWRIDPLVRDARIPEWAPHHTGATGRVAELANPNSGLPTRVR